MLALGFPQTAGKKRFQVPDVFEEESKVAISVKHAKPGS